MNTASHPALDRLRTLHRLASTGPIAATPDLSRRLRYDPSGMEPGARRDCPDCGHPTAGLRDKRVRVRGIREPVILTIAEPCGCLVDDHAAALQAAAPANRLDTGQTTEPAI